MQEYRQLLQNAKLELKKSKRKDYYKILGITRGASDEEIKRAYRKRALAHHPGNFLLLKSWLTYIKFYSVPDRHSSSSDEEKREHEKKFKEIGEAYGVLSDSKKKSRYDNGCDVEDLEGGGGHGYSDIDPNQIFQVIFSCNQKNYSPCLYQFLFRPFLVKATSSLVLLQDKDLDSIKDLLNTTTFLLRLNFC